MSYQLLSRFVLADQARPSPALKLVIELLREAYSRAEVGVITGWSPSNLWAWAIQRNAPSPENEAKARQMLAAFRAYKKARTLAAPVPPADLHQLIRPD